jgi:hypothetical protein
MNTMVSLPIVAALPIAAPAMAAEHPDDHAATLARAEQIVETLRTNYVAEGWTLFEPAAEEMLGFFRRRLEGKPERDNEFKMDVVEFFAAHGQSLDWVLFGDPSVMICRLAAAKSEERGEPDHTLIELADGYLVAAAEETRLNGILDQMHGERGETGKNPRGYRTVKRAYDKAVALGVDLEKQIHATPAKTIAGMIAKARCAEQEEFMEGINGDFSVSIAKDLLALSAPSAGPIAAANPPAAKSSSTDPVFGDLDAPNEGARA